MNDVIQEGTILTIDSDFIEKVEELVDKGIITVREYDLWCSSMYEKWLPRDIKFVLTRTDRATVYLSWVILGDGKPGDAYFDLTIFKALGYEIIDPEQTELDIFETPEFLLLPGELVLKTLQEQCGNWRHWVLPEDMIRKVQTAMADCGVVFYRP